MTDEERDRAIDFLLEQNARYEARLERDEKHIRELQQSFKLLAEANTTLTALALRSDERHDARDARTASLEETFQTIADIAARQDERIRTLEGRG